MPVFQTDRADEGAPADTDAHREKAGIEGITRQSMGEPQGIGKGDQRPARGQRLFKFGRCQRVSLSANELALFVAR